eukprot:1137978-Pelagomonas_calceolata.AAC.3
MSSPVLHHVDPAAAPQATEGNGAAEDGAPQPAAADSQPPAEDSAPAAAVENPAEEPAAAEEKPAEEPAAAEEKPAEEPAAAEEKPAEEPAAEEKPAEEPAAAAGGVCCTHAHSVDDHQCPRIHGTIDKKELRAVCGLALELAGGNARTPTN